MSKISAMRLQLAKILASFSSVETDKGLLQWPDECEIAVGLEVYVEGEDGSYVPAPDGDYEADGKIIKVEDGKIASIEDKEPVVVEELEEEDPLAEIKSKVEDIANVVAALVEKVAEIEAETATTKETLEKMSKMSAAFSAQIDVKSKSVAETGNAALDAKLKEMFNK